MINLDERYHSYLHGSKKMRIDGVGEKVKAYGWRDDGSSIIGHYVLTENYKLYYDMNGAFEKMKALEELSIVS
tara:strand:- start:296 stop:514 length:219 start_codon:yes stop_codon:yes gene_type:complete